MRLYYYLLAILFSGLVCAKPIFEIQADASLADQQAGYELTQLIIESGSRVDDIELNQYINTLSKDLVQYSGQSEQHFAFHLLSDNSINAFAGPYGIIGIHSGLILASDHEAEVAGVLAHEIAHITQNHLARYDEQTKHQPYFIAAAIIASILAKNSEVSQAIIGTSLAGVGQKSIKFTRDNEWEADKYGLELLQKTRFNPRGMASFFSKLADHEDAVEYLQTHSLSLNRITSSLESLPKNTSYNYHNSWLYELVKQRLYFKHYSRIGNSPNQLVNQYMKAYQLFHQEKYQDAKTALSPILSKNKTNIELLMARIYAKLNQFSLAKKHLTIANQLTPDNEAVAYYHAKIYSQFKQIPQAISQLKQFIKYHPTQAKTYDLLATLYLKNTQIDKHHLTKAFALAKQVKYKKSLYQLKRAKFTTTNPDLSAVANTYIKQLKQAIELFEIK